MKVEPFQQASQFRHQARRELGIADDEVVFGKIARLFALKGHEYLIDAAVDLVAGVPRLGFSWWATDGCVARLEDRIAQRGFADQLYLCGLVQPERIPFYLGAMDALVHTSLRERPGSHLASSVDCWLAGHLLRRRRGARGCLTR